MLHDKKIKKYNLLFLSKKKRTIIILFKKIFRTIIFLILKKNLEL